MCSLQPKSPLHFLSSDPQPTIIAALTKWIGAVVGGDLFDSRQCVGRGEARVKFNDGHKTKLLSHHVGGVDDKGAIHHRENLHLAHLQQLRKRQEEVRYSLQSNIITLKLE